MQDIIYDVAVSIDGFIAGVGGDITAFPFEGPVVDDYLARLQSYTSCIMGKQTYEFGYQYGMAPGANPYAHLNTFVVSTSIDLPEESEVTVVSTDVLKFIDQIAATSEGPIYLCGGGHFAGWMKQQARISRLRLKRAPIILGGGTPLFGEVGGPTAMRLEESKLYSDGVVFQEFSL